MTLHYLIAQRREVVQVLCVQDIPLASGEICLSLRETVITCLEVPIYTGYARFVVENTFSSLASKAENLVGLWVERKRWVVNLQR